MASFSSSIPEIELNSGSKMPVLGLGTATFSSKKAEEKQAMVQAIERGCRHFDTAAHYGSEEAVGEAIQEALGNGLIRSRQELFITSKLWCSDAHAERVLPALKKSLENLKLEYLDLYLIHWPVSATAGHYDLCCMFDAGIKSLCNCNCLLFCEELVCDRRPLECWEFLSCIRVD